MVVVCDGAAVPVAPAPTRRHVRDVMRGACERFDFEIHVSFKVLTNIF